MVARIGGHSAVGGRTLRGPMARLVGRVARRLVSLVGGLLQVVGLREVAVGVVLSLAAVVLSVMLGLAEVIWTVRLSVHSASRIACSGGRVRCFGIGSWSDNVARGCQWWMRRLCLRRCRLVTLTVMMTTRGAGASVLAAAAADPDSDGITCLGARGIDAC